LAWHWFVLAGKSGDDFWVSSAAGSAASCTGTRRRLRCGGRGEFVPSREGWKSRPRRSGHLAGRRCRPRKSWFCRPARGKGGTFVPPERGWRKDQPPRFCEPGICPPE
jgi:hypothetical protein